MSIEKFAKTTNAQRYESGNTIRYIAALPDCVLVLAIYEDRLSFCINADTFSDSGIITHKRLRKITAAVSQQSLFRIIAAADLNYVVVDYDTNRILSRVEIPHVDLIIHQNTHTVGEIDSKVRLCVVSWLGHTEYTLHTLEFVARLMLSSDSYNVSEMFARAINWPEPITIQEKRIVRDDRHPDRHKVYVRFKSPLTSLYKSIQMGKITCGNATKAETALLGAKRIICFPVAACGRKIYYIWPPTGDRQLSSNYIVVKDTKARPVHCLVDYTQKKNLRQINAAFAAGIYEKIGARVAFELIPQECPICMDAPAIWCCARCLNAFACGDCRGDLARCPLCRAEF